MNRLSSLTPLTLPFAIVIAVDRGLIGRVLRVSQPAKCLVKPVHVRLLCLLAVGELGPIFSKRAGAETYYVCNAPSRMVAIHDSAWLTSSTAFSS